MVRAGAQGATRDRSTLLSIFDEVQPKRIARTHELIAPFVRRTPVLDLGDCVLKLELLQHTGSFKTRGAFANLLAREVPPAGVVAASGGNHGAAVAYAAERRGIACRIFVPEISSPAKIARIRSYGAELTIVGDRYADALAASEEWAASSGAMKIHAFDQVETLLGQGTLGKELEEQLDGIDTVLVAVGGGGLIGGVAAWMAGRVRVIGVEPDGAPTLEHAFAAGRPVDAPTGSIAADSLAPRRIGELAFSLAGRFVERAVLVSDEAIRAAQQSLWERARVVAEPGGAAAYAALHSGAYRPRVGERIAIIVSGGNTVAVDFSR
ncbi:MAG: threonine/serine dehydratase [Candidatus Eremiobacteraeota bacterium]|nr:threonine/serine dehydratase [Candidatus Eremiobacteraeota bacterium]